MAENTIEKKHEYIIPLPIREAVIVRGELEQAVWEIARQEGIEETLKQVDFDIQAGKTAIDPNTVITVIFTYLAMKAVDKTTDKVYDQVWEYLNTKIIPKLTQRFGKTVLLPKRENKEKDKND